MIKTNAKILLNGIAQLQNDIEITSVVTDSRLAVKGSIFVCIKGERQDGHLFAKSAVENGAEFVVAEHELEGVSPDKYAVVLNSLDAMILISANYRAQFNPVLVGITGSVGKTTTKEFCYAVFSAFGETLKTEGNQNNEIGMPNTLFGLSEKTKYAVIEMGMQGLGEIEKLTLAAKPKGAIITGIGCAHLEQLKTRDNILKAKMEICQGFEKNGILVVPFEDEFLQKTKMPKNVKKVTFGFSEEADIYARCVITSDNSTNFILSDKKYGSFEVELPTIGEHNVKNALSAYALATRLGLDAQKACDALSNFKTTGHRQNIVMHSGMAIIEDCYNANPDSMNAALRALNQYPSKRKIAVLGDMFELGEIEREAHAQVGVCAAENGVSVLITVGKASQQMAKTAKAQGVTVISCETNVEAADTLKGLWREGDAILVKASHGMHFEEILQLIYN